MQRWALAGRFIGIGWYIGITIVGGILLGIWLDKKLGTTLIFTLFGLLLGLVLAGLGTYQMIAPIINDQQNDDKGDN